MSLMLYTTTCDICPLFSIVNHFHHFPLQSLATPWERWTQKMAKEKREVVEPTRQMSWDENSVLDVSPKSPKVLSSKLI